MDMVWSLVKLAREKRLMSIGITFSYWKDRDLMFGCWHGAEKNDHFDDIIECIPMLEKEVEKSIVQEYGE
jgi:hypothetical protein